MTNPDQPTRVAILGGGIGAVSAAFWLTSTPALRQRYKVTIHTHGWRLGGKCASGRNANQGNRIQEHGLHMLMGWYDVAFQTMRACWAEWEKQPDNPFQTWRDAFTPLRQVTLMQQVPDEPTGQWQTWNVAFPKLPGSPGEPADDFMHDVVHVVLGWLIEHMSNGFSLVAHLVPHLDKLVDAHAKAKQAPSLTPAARSGIYGDVLAVLVDFQAAFQRCVERPLEWFGAEGYKICAFADYALALLIGYMRDVLPDWEAGMEQLDEMEFRDWLMQPKHGGANPVLTRFAPVRVLYDLAFAYENGDSSSIDHGKIAAGTGLRTLLRMTFGYKDAPLWRMNAGMGDTIFTPLYQVLRQRGIDVHFFHRVSNVGLSTDGRAIDSIALTRQVDGAEGYDPLVPVETNGRVLPCWPAHPKWETIPNGPKIADEAWDLESMWCTYQAERNPLVTLRRGTDFDLVVLGIPPAALPDIGPELLAPGRCPPIKAMHDNMSWVSTQAAQLWLKPEIEDLGWKLGPTVLSAYADPFRSWGEMSHLLPMETWKWPAIIPGSCEYFCGTRIMPASLPPYGDRDFPRQQREQVRGAFGRWLQASATTLWPSARKGGGFDGDLLASEYYRVNLDPSEMYVQTFPGSVKYRLSPGQSGIDNLYLAGDWTKGTVDGGCAEGAFESGKMAAEAICHEPLSLPLERLPAFVSFQGCGEVDYPAPLAATDDLLYAFALEMNPVNVQALVDRTLAAPAKGQIEYHVLGNHVMLVFQHCGRFTSPTLTIGWAEDRETAIMIPLIEKGGRGFGERLVLWMPYLMIDVGLGMVTGRDVWGYNKSLGTTSMPIEPTDPASFTCETLVFRTFERETQARVEKLIEVSRTDAATRGPLQSKWKDAAGLLGAIAALELGLDLLSLAIGRDIPVINLKQMRDTRYTDLAVRQELVEAMLQVDLLDAGLLEGSHTVRILQCASHRIADDFGFPAAGVAPGDWFSVPAKLAFWTKMNFQAPVGRTVWAAR